MHYSYLCTKYVNAVYSWTYKLKPVSDFTLIYISNQETEFESVLETAHTQLELWTNFSYLQVVLGQTCLGFDNQTRPSDQLLFFSSFIFFFALIHLNRKSLNP